VVHWIGLSLSFSKSPSLLKMESGRKSYDRFHLLNFSVGTNSVRTGIFIGRPVSGRRCRAVHREPVSGRQRRAVHRLVWRSHQGCIGNPSRTGFRCRPDARWAVHRAVWRRARRDRLLTGFCPRFAPNGPISICYKRGFFPNGLVGFLVCS
jgi:hypothetical protein